MGEAAAKAALDCLCKDKLNLQTEVDTLKVEVQTSKDLRAHDQADKAKEIDDARENGHR